MNHCDKKWWNSKCKYNLYFANSVVSVNGNKVIIISPEYPDLNITQLVLWYVHFNVHICICTTTLPRIYRFPFSMSIVNCILSTQWARLFLGICCYSSKPWGITSSVLVYDYSKHISENGEENTIYYNSEETETVGKLLDNV